MVVCGLVASYATANDYPGKPGPPTNLRTTSVTPSEVNLAWTKPSNVDVAYYIVRRQTKIVATSSSGKGMTLEDHTDDIAEVSAGQTSYRDVNDTVCPIPHEYELACSPIVPSSDKTTTYYTYKVRVEDTADRYSDGSNSVELKMPNAFSDTTSPTTPGKPTLTNAASGTPKVSNSRTTIAIKWSASSDAGSGVNEYIVRRGTTDIAHVPAGTTSYTDTGLKANTNYLYKIRAVDRAGLQSSASGDDFTTAK